MSGLNKNTAFFGLHTSKKMCAEQLIIPRDFEGRLISVPELLFCLLKLNLRKNF